MQIDSTSELVLQQRFGVEAFPSLYFLRDGETRECFETRTVAKVSAKQDCADLFRTCMDQWLVVESCRSSQPICPAYPIDHLVQILTSRLHHHAAAGICGGWLAQQDAGATHQESRQLQWPCTWQAPHVSRAPLCPCTAHELLALTARCQTMNRDPGCWSCSSLLFSGCMQDPAPCEESVQVLASRKEVWGADAAGGVPVAAHHVW